MSRTIRRPNHEATRNNSWQTGGFKTARHYTTYDVCPETSNRLYRPMDKRDTLLQWRHYHGESSHANARSPSWLYRHWREAGLRAFNKRELLKFKMREDYDPMCEANPRDCGRDWM